MYSKSQITEIRRRMDYGWNIEENLENYKGLVTIFSRERRKELNEINKLRRRQAHLIRELRKECQYFYAYHGNNLHGNKQRIKCAVQDKILQMSFQNRLPTDIIGYFQHSNHKKQTLLDRLKYRRNLRIGAYKTLRLEKAALQDKLETVRCNLRFRRTMQIVNNRIQVFIVRQNAAAEIQVLYKAMLHLLRKDSQYLDAILNVLRMDCEEQCRCVLRAAELGQLAEEELTEIGSEYTWLETEVRVHGKEREKQVKMIKKTARELTFKCQLLCRAGSNISIFKPFKSFSVAATEIRGPDEIANIEMIIDRVREATLSATFQDIFPRIIHQVQQEHVLYWQSKRMKKLRDNSLQMKHHSETILTFLKHEIEKSVTNFAKESEKLKKQIRDEEYRLQKERDAIQSTGEMLSTLKSALSSLFETLNRIRDVKEGTEIHSTSSESEADLISKPRSLKEIEGMILPPIERNSKLLLNLIEEKLKFLLAHSSPAVTADQQENDAKVTREREVLAKRMHMSQNSEVEQPEPVDLLEDSTIMSRHDVKHLSKALVEKQLRLMDMARCGIKPRQKFT